MRQHVPVARRAAVVLAATTTLAVALPLAATVAQASPELPGASASQEHAYREYLSDRTPTGYSVGWGSLYTDKSYDGSPLSLLVDGQEQTFDRGLWAHGPSTITYNDVQAYGYERFEAWVGVGSSARVSGKSAEVVFKVVGDGKVLWESGTMTERSDAQFVSVDISSVEVLQLVVEASNVSAHPNNHTIWADAVFSKEEATPWLSASDKEFTNPEQVTEANILEGVFARTLSGPVGETDAPVTGSDGTLRNGKEGNDLSDDVTYTTNYVAGQTGEFTITYHVTDAQGIERTRTVGMTVLGDEVYRTDADIDYLTTPFASYLYAGRDYFDEQGKAAFDLCVETLLGFGKNVGSYQLVNHWGEQVYQVSVDLQAAGIYMSTADAGYLTSTIMDCEPRTFHVKDWGADVSSRNGLAGTVTFYVAKRYGQVDESGQVYYHTRLLQAEANASRFLSNLDGSVNEMTDAQRLRAVLYPYADWIKYDGGQVMDEALADGMSVCGGNARGSIYLSQRMGIKAYWVRTDSHAWSNVKLNHDDSGKSGGAYYRVDLLARPGCFLSVDAEHEGFHGHHKEIYFNRMKGYPDMTSESYPFAWTAWPSVALNVEDSWVVLAPEDKATFDARNLIASASSIYDGSLLDDVQIDYGHLYDNATEDAFTEGYFKLTYTVTDTHGNSDSATVNVQVVGGDVIKANAGNLAGGSGNNAFLDGTNGNVSLWNGSSEVAYSNGLRQNEACSATFDVEGKGYTYFDAWAGINGTVRANTQYGMNGKVQLEVWATVRGEDGATEEVNLYTSPIMGWYAVQQHVLVAIPENAVSVTLKNVPKGGGNNHAAWGNPRFLTIEVLDKVPVAPAISGVEDGATYDAAVTPQVSDASSVTLYRKNLPVTIDPGTGDAVSTADATSSDWGEEVSGYVPGSPVEEEGVYTLVAKNEYRKTIVRFTIEKDLVRVTDPIGIGNLVYSGTAQTGVPAGSGYTLSNPTGGATIDSSGNAVATSAGTYTVTATPNSGCVWLDGTTGEKTVSWTVSRATLTATYVGESVQPGEAPAYAVEVTGFVNDETAESASGYQAPSIADADKPANLQSGALYALTPSGGSADNYRFEYVSGSLAVGYRTVEVPSAAQGLVANGGAQVGVPAGSGYVLSTSSEGAWIDEDGNAVASEAGTYVALARPADGYVWENGTSDQVSVEWTVSSATSGGGTTGGGTTGGGTTGGGTTGGTGGGAVGDLGGSTTSTPNGTTATVNRDEDGKATSVDVLVSDKDAAVGSVTLPTESLIPVTSDSALPVTVKVPSGATISVTVPVAADSNTGSVSPGAVLVRVNADGTETVMPKTSLVDGGLSLEVSGETTLKVVDAAQTFPDVASSDWFAPEVVPFASARGILTGVVTSDGTLEFRGNETTNRAMFVTMLHRLELEPSVSSSTSFADVSGTDWYFGSAAWGVKEGVVAGYGDGSVFGGSDPVTREQMAVFMFRYAQWLGRDTSARASLSFPDADKVSSWASEAMSWAVAEGLFGGDSTTGELRPNDGATRAEAATIIMRFL